MANLGDCYDITDVANQSGTHGSARGVSKKGEYLVWGTGPHKPTLQTITLQTLVSHESGRMQEDGTVDPRTTLNYLS